MKIKDGDCMTDNNNKKRIALLVDGDNVNASFTKTVYEFLRGRGHIVVKRIYGNWTKTNLYSTTWLKLIQNCGFVPIQQFDFVVQKNTTDIMLTTQAIDILQQGLADIFVIVSSDRDFLPLSAYLREHGAYVMGFGNRDTHTAYRMAVDEFYVFGTSWQRPQDFDEEKCVKAYEREALSLITKNKVDEIIRDFNDVFAAMSGNLNELHKLIYKAAKNIAVAHKYPGIHKSVISVKEFHTYWEKNNPTLTFDRFGYEDEMKFLQNFPKLYATIPKSCGFRCMFDSFETYEAQEANSATDNKDSSAQVGDKVLDLATMLDNLREIVKKGIDNVFNQFFADTETVDDKNAKPTADNSQNKTIETQIDTKQDVKETVELPQQTHSTVESAVIEEKIAEKIAVEETPVVKEAVATSKQPRKTASAKAKTTAAKTKSAATKTTATKTRSAATKTTATTEKTTATVAKAATAKAKATKKTAKPAKTNKTAAKKVGTKKATATSSAILYDNVEISTIQQNLKKFIKKSGKTMNVFASEIGIPISTIYTYITDNNPKLPKQKNLEKIVEYCGKDILMPPKTNNTEQK